MVDSSIVVQLWYGVEQLKIYEKLSVDLVCKKNMFSKEYKQDFVRCGLYLVSY
jgi:hypothetical protein